MRTKEWLINLATVVMCVSALALAGTALSIARTRSADAAPPGPDAPRAVAGWRALADPARAMGPRGAPVQIVEFSDFQCPYCATAANRLRALQERYPGRIAVTYRHFPLRDIHPHAAAAALASECAGEQGRFREYHDLLFARQDSIGRTPWEALAAEAGVPDGAGFRRCVDEQRYRARVDEDVRAANRLDVRATPTFVVEGTLYTGLPADAVLDSLLAPALAASSR